MSPSPVLATAAAPPLATACGWKALATPWPIPDTMPREERLLDQRPLAAHHRSAHPGLAGAGDEPRHLGLDHRAGTLPRPGAAQVMVLSLA